MTAPGRKTDVKDSQWIAELLQHGLLKASFVPERPMRAVAGPDAAAGAVGASEGAVANRIHKTLEDANIKRASVASDVLGRAGRAMLRAIIGGESEPDRPGGPGATAAAGEDPAVAGGVVPGGAGRHRFLLGMLLEEVGFVEGNRPSGGADWGGAAAPFCGGDRATGDGSGD